MIFHFGSIMISTGIMLRSIDISEQIINQMQEEPRHTTQSTVWMRTCLRVLSCRETQNCNAVLTCITQHVMLCEVLSDGWSGGCWAHRAKYRCYLWLGSAALPGYGPVALFRISGLICWKYLILSAKDRLLNLFRPICVCASTREDMAGSRTLQHGEK